MAFSSDQFKALNARIDNLQQAGLQIEAIELHRGMNNNLIASVTTTGTPSHLLPDNYGYRFIISENANIINPYQLSEPIRGIVTTD